MALNTVVLPVDGNPMIPTFTFQPSDSLSRLGILLKSLSRRKAWHDILMQKFMSMINFGYYLVFSLRFKEMVMSPDDDDKRFEARFERLTQMADLISQIGQIGANSNLPQPARERFAALTGASSAAEFLRDLATADRVAKAGALEAARVTYLRLLTGIDDQSPFQEQRIGILLSLACIEADRAQAEKYFAEAFEAARTASANCAQLIARCHHRHSQYLVKSGDSAAADEELGKAIAILENEAKQDEFAIVPMIPILRERAKLQRASGRESEADAAEKEARRLSYLSRKLEKQLEEDLKE
jgi:hypothetical protein